MEKSTISKIANSTFTSQFFGEEESSNRCVLPIINNRVETLHALVTPKLISGNENQSKPLLLYAAYHNSPVSAVYLLRRGATVDGSDADGKTALHVCAYTGHIDVLKAIRNEVKLCAIKKLNEQFIEILQRHNYKRTDAKKGKLKLQVSQTRQKIFETMQRILTDLYQRFASTMIADTFKYFMLCVKSTNRNCFHLVSLNRYQRCSSTMELMFQELGDFNLHLDGYALQIYEQANGCFHTEETKIDPRSFQDTIALIEEFILPERLSSIKKTISKKVEEEIEIILASKDKDGHNPLFLASKDGCTAMINLISKLESSVSKRGQDKEGLLRVACHNLARSHIMDLCEASKEADSKNMNFLLSCGEEINKKKTIFGTFALLEAVKAFQKERNIEPVKTLILSGANINEQDTNGWTVLHHASQKGLQEIFELVFKIWQEGKVKKILINKATNKNYHLLHIAAFNNHPEVIRYLFTCPQASKLELNMRAVDGDRCTMLHHAARKGALQALRAILEVSPDLIYEGDIRSNTALHYAAMNNHIECIKHLLFFDSDFDKLQTLQNSRGKLARDLTVNKKPFESVFTSAREGNVNQVRKMIEETPTLKSIRTPGKSRSLLMLAVISQHLLLVKLLIQQGADKQLKDKSGKSSLEYGEQALKLAKTKQEQVVAKNILSFLS